MEEKQFFSPPASEEASSHVPSRVCGLLQHTMVAQTTPTETFKAGWHCAPILSLQLWVFRVRQTWAAISFETLGGALDISWPQFPPLGIEGR